MGDTTSGVDVSVPSHSFLEVDDDRELLDGVTGSGKGERLAGTPRVYTGIREAEDHRLELNAKARAARDCMLTACSALQSGDEDVAESNYFSARDTILDMWEISAVRGRPFRRLLKLLDAALRRSQITDFDVSQRDELVFAFDALCATFLDEEHVTDCNFRFAQSGIDILGPIRRSKGQRLRVTIEESE